MKDKLSDIIQNSSPDITIIGNSVIDVIAHPVPKDIFERGSVPAKDIQMFFGGDALNESVILSRFGKNVELLTKVGKDDAGYKIMEHLRSCGVETGKIIAASEVETSVNIVLVDENGERFFVTNPAGSQRKLCEDDIIGRMENCGKIVSFASMFVSSCLDIDAMTRIFAKIKERDAILAVDLTRAKKGERLEDLKNLLPYIDYIFPNEGEISLLTGCTDVRENIRRLLSYGVGCAVIKCGGKGCLIGQKDGIFSVPAYPVKQCIDTTGAGDSFVSGFLWALSEGWSVPECGCFATVVASCSVEQVGATKGVQSLEKAMRRYEEIKDTAATAAFQG